MSVPNDLILYHYSFSPFARRIVWYLQLRQIEYAQCLQPPILPRPDLKRIGVNYRRIPVLAMGRSIYHDTRLQIQALDELFPASDQHPGITPPPACPDQRLMTTLLSKFYVSQFGAFSALIPTDLPLMQDPKFQKDRQDFSGSKRSWKPEDVEKGRALALTQVVDAAAVIEEVLSDGRQFICGSPTPSLADIEAVWPFHWLIGMKGALPPHVVSAERFPLLYAWVERFSAALKEAKARGPKVATIDGEQAAKHIMGAKFIERDVPMDASDPQGLAKGTLVEVFPTDTGSSHPDKGKLLGVDSRQVVIELETGVRVHTPRIGFRVKPLDEAKL